MKEINVSILHAVLKYYPETGCFQWKERPREYFKTDRDCAAWNTRFALLEAGTVKSNGYVYLRLFKEDYLAHRVAIAMCSGQWPSEEVDHKDRVRHNNRYTNLRTASGLENHQNMSVYDSNTSGTPGVHFCNTHGKWKAKITVAGRVISLGYHGSKTDAVAARIRGERKHKLNN